jgi:glucuronide carrier protein
MDTLKGNKPLLMLCLSSFFFLSGYLALTSVQLFYLRDVLGRLDLYPVLSIVQLVLTFFLAAFMPKLVRNVGKKRVYIYSSLITVAGGVIIFLTPASQVWIGFSGLVISLVGVLAVNIVVWALEADTVEYGEWKTGVRTEGITYALFSFTRKSGQAVGGALAAYALALGGYKSGGVAQTSDAVFGIQIAAGALPAVLTILAVLVMTKYTLTDARHAEILKDIQERRTKSVGEGESADASTTADAGTPADASTTAGK